MKHVVVIGCGVVGAMIAYELSQISALQVTVLDRQPPAQAATGAALGVLMGIISQKTKGRAWAMRQASIQRYRTLLPELEADGQQPTWNHQGILKLCFANEDLERWQELTTLRQQQGWQLELWSPAQVQDHCPQIDSSAITAAIYSPQDYQVDPTALTLALVNAAQQRGVSFRFDADVQTLVASQPHYCEQIVTSVGSISADWIVIAAGLGSTPLTACLGQTVPTHAVLGQAMRVRLPQPLGDPTFQPVITGNDIHIVPVADHEYWVGATVEFPVDQAPIVADSEQLTAVWQGAIDLCPALADATILKTWTGLRPRPQNRAAPIVEPLAGYANVFLATGHYRNGVLLAPATAQLVRSALETHDFTDSESR
ncbi:MAG: NAD(P)/FAD-dependent oxidoreductase [Leptolyngbya sp. IPPAS B-1204]|nr:MAG: FAD-binding oxidoreductase [Leptolyngbya sp. IPPAS B-1204]